MTQPKQISETEIRNAIKTLNNNLKKFDKPSDVVLTFYFGSNEFKRLRKYIKGYGVRKSA